MSHEPQWDMVGKRVLVSAPRPDSFMLRRRSLREAGRIALTPAGQVWHRAVALERHPVSALHEQIAAADAP